MTQVCDALDALMVAHDALLEGRDAAPALESAPRWARHDRLLGIGTGLFQAIRDQLASRMARTMGPALQTESGTILSMILDVQAKTLVDLWELTDLVQAALGGDV